MKWWGWWRHSKKAVDEHERDPYREHHRQELDARERAAERRINVVEQWAVEMERRHRRDDPRTH